MSDEKHFYPEPSRDLPDLPEGVRVQSGCYDGHGQRIVIAAARFNIRLTRALVTSAVDTLLQRGVQPADITVVWVPGSFELPQALHRLYRDPAPHAMLACGVVVEGETRHAGLIMNSVTQALTQLSLEHDLPVIDAVVHAYTMEAAEARCLGGPESRGAYAALAALETLTALDPQDS